MTIQQTTNESRHNGGYVSILDKEETPIVSGRENRELPILDTRVSDLSRSRSSQNDVKQPISEKSNHRSYSVKNISKTLLSPRSVLQKGIKGLVKEEFKEESKEVIGGLLQNSPPRDQIFQSQQPSSEDLAIQKFDMEKFKALPLLKNSQSRELNKRFMKTLQSLLQSGQTQSIDSCSINKYVRSNVRKEVDAFLNRLDDMSSISNRDLEKCIPILTKKLYAKLCNINRLYEFVRPNLSGMKVMIGNTFDRFGWCGRSDWLDCLVESLELVTALGEFQSTIYSEEVMKELKFESLEFYQTILTKVIRDDSIRSLLLGAIHSEGREALETLEQLTFWGTDEGYCKLSAEVREAFRWSIKHQHAQDITTHFKECFFKGGLLENVDLEQVARSYICCPKRIHSVLKINEIDVDAKGIEGNTGECQNQFFEKFLSILYSEGYSKESSEESMLDARTETEKFLKKEAFEGQEIILAGSSSAWAVCDGKLRKMYPLLFSTKLKTRMNQGIKCYIRVESRNKYSILINRTYTTYPQAPGASKDSFAIDKSRPLCSTLISWQIDFIKDEGWSHSISTPSIHRKKATDDEWDQLLDILLTPGSLEEASLNLPNNQELKNMLLSL